MAITTIYNTGFEAGLVNASGAVTPTNAGGLADVVTGTASATSTNPRTGTYALLVGSGSSATHIRDKFYSGTNRAKVFRFGMRIDEAPDAATVHFSVGVAALSTVTALALTVDNSLVLRITNGATTQTVGTMTLGAWHLVEVQYNSSANPHTMVARMDGGATASHTLALAAQNIDLLRFGASAFTGIVRYDDLIVGDFTVAATDWYGDGYGDKLLPGSDGSHSFTANDFSTGDAGTVRAPSYTDFWLMVDDPVPWTTTRSTTDNIAQRAVRVGYVEIDPATAPNKPTANGVQALLEYSSVTATANTASCIILNSASTETSIFGTSTTPADWSDLTNFFKGAQVTKPAAGWTAAEISALRWRFGYSNDISPVPTCQALMLEMDYPFVGIPDQNMAEWIPGRR